jgi:hypothetical protein
MGFFGYLSSKSGDNYSKKKQVRTIGHLSAD